MPMPLDQSRKLLPVLRQQVMGYKYDQRSMLLGLLHTLLLIFFSMVKVESMEYENIKSAFGAKKAQHNMDLEPKEEQLMASKAIAEGKNCICFLPTGFGKTLCFVIDAVIRETPSITLVVSPLIALMENQKDTLGKWNFTCIRIGTDTTPEELAGVEQGTYRFVFVSPEYALKPKCRSIFVSEIWQQRLNCIVFDEAHCISDWGEDFRPEYKEMAQLRSFFKVPVMALTATSTSKIKEDIMTVLQITDDDTVVISKSPDRPNIFIQCYKKHSSDYMETLQFLSEYLKANVKKSKKCIIYCRSIDTVSEVFINLKQSLGENAYIDKVEKSSNLIVEMFHKCTHDSSKSRILTEFVKTDSSIRCLVATVALGMGLDIKDVDLIIHIGCPKSVISYWQEAGRCARDGRQGLSLIIYDNFTASLKTTEKAMSEIVKSAEDKCLRQLIMDHFTVSESKKFNHRVCDGCQEVPCKCPSCLCCSFCSKKCKCAVRGAMSVDFLLKEKVAETNEGEELPRSPKSHSFEK